MKISQFNNKYEFLMKLQLCCNFLIDRMNLIGAESVYIEIPRLNILVCSDVDNKLFLSVVNEYRSHKALRIKILASLYIYAVLFFIKVGVAKILFDSHKLRAPSAYPIILGGNNRLRFINICNTSALLVEKDFSNNFFIKNIYTAYSDGFFRKMSVMPPIFIISDYVYLEKQVIGVAINRTAESLEKNACVSNVLNKFFQIQHDCSTVVALEEFMQLQLNCLTRFLLVSGSCFDAETSEFLKKIFMDAIFRIKNIFKYESVKVAPSHGDLNKGNIFFGRDGVYIIDWEYYMYRGIDYDKVVFDLDLRHMSVENYVHVLEKFTMNKLDMVIFLIDDLLFRILNFKTDVEDSRTHIITIHEFLLKNLNEISHD